MVREADTNGDGLISKEELLTLLQQTSVPDSLDQYISTPLFSKKQPISAGMAFESSMFSQNTS